MNLEGDLCLDVMRDPPAVICHKLQDHLAKGLHEHFVTEHTINRLLIAKYYRQDGIQILHRQLTNYLETIAVLNRLKNTSHVVHVLEELHWVDNCNRLDFVIL